MGSNAKTCKNSDGAIFHMRDFRRIGLVRFSSALYADTLFVSSEGHQPGSQKQTSVTKVCYGNVNSFLKELINIS